MDTIPAIAKQFWAKIRKFLDFSPIFLYLKFPYFAKFPDFSLTLKIKFHWLVATLDWATETGT